MNCESTSFDAVAFVRALHCIAFAFGRVSGLFCRVWRSFSKWETAEFQVRFNKTAKLAWRSSLLEFCMGMRKEKNRDYVRTTYVRIIAVP